MNVTDVIVRASAEWPAFKIDPAWCMQYLELTDKFLREHRLFTAEQPLVHAIDAGLRTSEKLPADCWCDGFDRIMRFGWAAPVPQRLHGSRQWMSLL